MKACIRCHQMEFDMLTTLQTAKDFLALTLANLQGFAHGENSKFMLSAHTQVSVVDTGVIIFEPITSEYTETSKDIVISSGVHGNETAPIEICNELIRQLLAEEIIAKQRVLFLFGNPQAIYNGTRIVDENLNRLFSGEHSRGAGLINPERIRAKQLEQYVADFFNKKPKELGRQRIHYDLHTAIRGAKHEKFAIYPFRHHRAYNAEQLTFLEAAGVDCVLFHHEPTTTFSYFSSNEFGADAFTIELGKVFPMGQNDLSNFAEMSEMLTRLITATPLRLPEYDPSRLHLFRVSRALVKHAEPYEFTFATDVQNFTTYQQGDVLAVEAGQEIKVEAEMEAIVFPNAKVPVGQRTLLCLVAEPNPKVI